jgi:hypothetical protein
LQCSALSEHKLAIPKKSILDAKTTKHPVKAIMQRRNSFYLQFSAVS